MKNLLGSEVIGIAIIFNQLGQILIDQRLDSNTMPGMWEFPGGKQELEEKIEDTISREVLEELGIEIDVGEKLLSFDYSYDNKRLHFEVHFCRFVSGNPQPLASQKLLWIEPKNLLQFNFPAANNLIIASLFKHLGLDIE